VNVLAPPQRRAAASSPWRLLVALTPRLGHPWPVVGSLGAAVLLVAVRWDGLGSLVARLNVVRTCCVLLVLGVVFLFDDVSRGSTAASVVTLRRRTGARLVVAATLVAVGFAAASAVVAMQGTLGPVLLGLALEVAGYASLGALLTLGVQRRADVDEPGTAGGLLLLAFLAGQLVLTPRWPMLVGPGPQWPAAHIRWAALLLVTLGGLAWVTRDPARRTARAWVAGAGRPVS